jgi:acylphosphatase
MADLASFRATVHGRVQGVFFRGFVERWAEQLKLTGEVRNLRDGTVEVRAEGERQQLEKLLDYLKTGPPPARVDRVETEWGEYTGNYSGFTVTY